MNKGLELCFLLSQFDYEYNSHYSDLSDEEKRYMDYVDECLNDSDEKFSDACTRAMLLILDSVNKLETNEELSKEETTIKKETLLSGFTPKDKDRIESFMYACIQIMGIYSEESIQERNASEEKSLVKKSEQ